MNFLNFSKTVRCSENISNSEQLKSDPISSIPEVMRETLKNETGRDRVLRMFSQNEFGSSPEIKYVVKSGATMAAIAAIFGGVSGVYKARDDFLRRNVASAFESKHLARRSLTDTMTLSGVKSAFSAAVKYGSFSTFYLLGTMTVANYRDKVSPLEHVAFGALLGGLARINYGIKGFIVAGGLGGFLGFLAGGVITLSMRFSGTTLEELRYYQHEDHYAKIQRMRKRAEEKKKKEQQ